MQHPNFTVNMQQLLTDYTDWQAKLGSVAYLR